MFWIVESTNRGHNASSGGRCSFVPGDLLYLLFVDRNWTHPHQPRARYAAISLSIMTPSPHLFPSSSPQSRSSCCLCSAAAVKQPQPVDELPNSRILKLFCPHRRCTRINRLPLQSMLVFPAVRPFASICYASALLLVADVGSVDGGIRAVQQSTTSGWLTQALNSSQKQGR